MKSMQKKVHIRFIFKPDLTFVLRLLSNKNKIDERLFEIVEHLYGTFFINTCAVKLGKTTKHNQIGANNLTFIDVYDLGHFFRNTD